MSGETGRRERKSITVVFADLVGFTARADALDPEDVEAFLRPYHERLRAEFQRFGGTVEKFIGDAVVAIFGAPVAHEDDPERAVRAAIAIRDAIREAGELEVRIAVNTGEAIVRLDARADAGEGIATGDVLNTASRLQAVAPVNGILVGEPTYRATRDVISYAPAAAVEAKGKPVPLAVWEAVEARSRLGVDVRQGSATPLVGRERERSILLDTLARVEAERTPQLVTLVGVPGIGKSRLVSELLGSLEQSDEMRYWRQGRSLPYGEGVSFWALGEMVKAQAGILDGDAPDDVAAKLELAVRELVEPDEAAWVTTSLRPLVGLGGSGEGDGPMRREESFAAWRRLFEAMAERRPLVLVFEDLHWADDGLLDFVDHLVDWATGVPILVACTARPELLERRPGWAGGKPNALTLGVAPLSEVESARLLSLLLGTPVLAAETQAALLERASGNPLYAEQFARLLQERGSLDELSLPETVQGLIAARLDTLAADEKALLQEAAVVGKVFWAGALPARVDVDQAALLHGLERKEFVRRERRSSVAGDAEYSFRHVLVRDVAYAQIPRGDRIAKHLRTAAWIDAVTTSGDSGELVAHHLAAALELSPAGLPADVADRAQVAFADAGEHALALGAFALAVRWFRAALDLVPEVDGRRGRLLFGLGRAEYGATGAGDAMLEEAIALLEASGDPTTAAEAEALLTLSAWQRGDREAWVRHLDHAIELVADLPPSRAKASVLATRARRMVIAGDNAAGLPVAREARAMAESLGLVDLQAHALNSLGMALHATGEGDGYDELRRSIELYDSINSVDASIGWNNLASFLEADGRLSEAGEAARTATRYGRRFGYEPLLRWDRYNTVDWDYLEGRWDDAVRRADALIDETEAGAAHYMAPLTLQVRGRIRSARGDLAGAIRDSEAALEITRTIGDVQSVVPGLAHWVAVLVDAGRMAEADAAATELLGRQRAGGLTFRAPAFLIDALERLGRLDEMLANYGNRRRTRWLEAAERVAAGDWPGAAEVYSVIGSPTDEALARLRAAAQLVGEGRRADADAQAARAIEFWRSVGASRHVAEGEALLAATA